MKMMKTIMFGALVAMSMFASASTDNTNTGEVRFVALQTLSKERNVSRDADFWGGALNVARKGSVGLDALGVLPVRGSLTPQFGVGLNWSAVNFKNNSLGLTAGWTSNLNRHPRDCGWRWGVSFTVKG